VAIAWQAVKQKKGKLQDMREELGRASTDSNQLMGQEDLDSEARYEAWLARYKKLERPRKGLLEQLGEPIYGEAKEEYKARETQLDHRQERSFEMWKAEPEDRVEMAKGQKGRLMTKFEQTDRDLFNMLQNHYIAQEERDKTQARLERLNKEGRELVRPQAGLLTPSHPTLSRMC
jgi:hypothetical protein